MPILDRITIGNQEILVVDTNPTSVGVDVPLGSLIMLNDGTGTYQKIGPLDTDWSLVITDNNITTANNGLTKTLNNIQLGGALTQNTTIDGMSLYSLNINNLLGNNIIEIDSDTALCISKGYVALTDWGNNGMVELGAGNAYIDLNASTSGNSNIDISVGSQSIKMYETARSDPDNGSNNYLVISDGAGSKGLVYKYDYSANFTPESLVSKRYVDNAIISSTITADNGLTLTSGNIQLGGTLLQNTIITGLFDIQLGTYANKLNVFEVNTNAYIGYYSDDGTNSSYINIYPNTTQILTSNNANTNIYSQSDFKANKIQFYVSDASTNISHFLLTSNVFDIQLGNTLTRTSPNGFSSSYTNGAINTSVYIDSSQTSFTISNSTTNETTIILGENGDGITLYTTPDNTNIATINIKQIGQTITNNGANNIFIITDNIASKGLVYADDYSANFTPESLVSKRYVDNAITTSAITVDNGLTLTSGNIQLGGLLTEETTIDGGSNGNSFSFLDLNQFYISSNDININANFNITVFSNGVNLYGNTYINLSIPDVSIRFEDSQTISDGSSNNNIVIFDNNGKGITYDDYYESNFTDLSLVTKLYVDNAITNATTNTAITSKLLTGLTITGSTITSTDTILQAFGKLQNQINSVLGGATYISTYNASTNTPTLVDGTGTKGHYYVVSVAGIQNFGSGNIDFNIGDWVIYNGTIWQKVDNTDAVTSVNGFIGAVVLTTTNISEGTNLYFTNTRVNTQLNTYTGDVTFSSGVSTIGASKVTNAMLVNSSLTIGTTNIALGATSTILAGLTSVTSTTFVGALTGNATTATTLQTPRNINGVSFNGSADITVTAAAGTLTGTTLNATVVLSSLTSVSTITSGVWNGTSISTTYTDAKVISISGTSNRITVTGTTTVPIIDIASTYVGQTSITTLGTITTGTLTNTVVATLSDTLFTLQDNSDATKQINFELSNLTTGTTRSIAIPDYNGMTILKDNVFRNILSTTNATTTTIQTISTISNTSYLLEVRIICKKISGAGAGNANDSNTYIRTVKVKNIAGTVTLSTVQSDFTQEDIAANNVTITVSGTNVLINVIGTANNNIDWIALSELIKI